MPTLLHDGATLAYQVTGAAGPPVIEQAVHGVIIERANDVNRMLDEFWADAESKWLVAHGSTH